MVLSLNSESFDAMQVAAFAKLYERLSDKGVPLNKKIGSMQSFVDLPRLQSLLQSNKLSLAGWAAVYEAFRLAAGADSFEQLPRQCHMIADGMRDIVLKMPGVKKAKIGNDAERVRRANLAVQALIAEQNGNGKIEDFMRNYESNEVQVESGRKKKLAKLRAEIYRLESGSTPNRVKRQIDHQEMLEGLEESDFEDGIPAEGAIYDYFREKA